jgi:SAM-dependent methyltransferase
MSAMSLRLGSPALEAYEALAADYDTFTAGYEHDRWLDAIVELARGQGFDGGRVLDVACGTGKSAEPLVRRGFDVTACDVSPSMAALATQRLGPTADVVVADMRALPESLGSFALVTCLDDAINYLTDVEDLAAAFASVRRVLAPDGVYVFDVNTLHAYAEAFDRDFVVETDDALFCWHAEQEPEVPGTPDAPHVAQLDVFVPRPDGTWVRRTGRHQQRHFSDEVIQSSLESAGLRCRQLVGQSPGIQMSTPVDEQRHTKRLYVVTAA